MGDVSLLNASLLTALVVKAVATGLFVVAMAVLVERAPPSVAALSIAFPVVIGPAYVIVAIQEEPSFLATAAEFGVGALVGTLAYTTLVGRLFERLPGLPLVLVGLAAWITVATAATAVDLPLAGRLALFAAALAFSGFLLPFDLALKPSAGGVHRRPPYGTAVQAALLVALTTGFAQTIGGRWTAVLLTMPLGMIFLTLVMKRSMPPAQARAALQSARLGLVPLAVFIASIRVLADWWGALEAIGVALALAMATSVGLTAMRQIAIINK